MANLIKITSKKVGSEAQNTVNARDLWNFLESKKDFSDWIKQQIKSLDLEEDFDYCSFPLKVEREIGGTVQIEYIVTLDVAKHIAMASRTQKGKEVRQYFIDVEKEYQAKKKEHLQTVGIEFITTQIKMERQIEVICELIDAANAEIKNSSIALLNNKIQDEQQSLNQLLETFVSKKKKMKKEELKKITKILGW